MNREAVYGALFAKVSGLPAFKVKSRRLQHWTDTPSSEQPALFMAQVGEIAQTTTGQFTKWMLRVDFYLYVKTSKNQPPGPVINPLLDAVCDAINTFHPVTGKNNLAVEGVEWCRIDGNIETDEGTLGDQAVAIIPVLICAT